MSQKFPVLEDFHKGEYMYACKVFQSESTASSYPGITVHIIYVFQNGHSSRLGSSDSLNYCGEMAKRDISL